MHDLFCLEFFHRRPRLLKEANLQKKENCQSKNAHKVKKECTIHHHLPTHAEKAMLSKQKQEK